MRWWQTVMMAVGSVGAGLLVTGPSYAADTTVTTPQQDEYNSIVAANRGLRRDSSMFHPNGTMRLNIDGGNDNLFGIGVAGTADDNGQIRLAFTPDAEDPSPSGISSHILTSLDYDPRPGDSANDGSVLHFVGRTTATGNGESRTVGATAHLHVFNRNGNFAPSSVSRSDRINGAVHLQYRMLSSAYKWYTLDNNGIRLDFSFDDGQTYLLPFYIGDIDGHESWSVSHAQLMWLRGTNVSRSTDTAHWTGNVHYQQHDHQVEILGHDFAGGSSTSDNAYGTSYRNSIAGSASGMIYGSSFSIGVEHAGNQPMNEWIGKQNGAGPLRADIGGFGKIGVTPPAMVQVRPEKIVVSEDDKQRQTVKNDDKYRNNPQYALSVRNTLRSFERNRFNFNDLNTWRVPDAKSESIKHVKSLEQHDGSKDSPVLAAHAGEHVTWILHTGQRFTNGGQFHSYTFTDQLPAGLAGHDSNFDANQHKDIQASDVYLVDTNMTNGGPISLADGHYGQVSLAKQADGSTKLTVKLTAMGLALINKQSAASRNAVDTYDDWSIAVRTVVWPSQDDMNKLTPGNNDVVRMDNMYTVSGRDGIIGKTPDPESNHSLVEVHSDPLPSNDLSIKTAAKKMNFRRNIVDLQGQVQYLDQIILPERDQAIFHRYEAFSLVTSPVDNDHGFDGGEYNDLNHYRPVLLVGANHHEVALTSSEYSWDSDKKLHVSLNEKSNSQALAAINQAMKADSEAGRTVQIVLAGKDLSHDSTWWKALQDTSTWHNPGGLELDHKAKIGKLDYHLQTDVQGDFMSWHAKKTSADLHNHIQVVGKDPRVHIKVVDEHDQGDQKVVTYRLFANQGNDKDTTKPWSYEFKVGDNSLGALIDGSGGWYRGVPTSGTHGIYDARQADENNGGSLIGKLDKVPISYSMSTGDNIDYWVPDRFSDKETDRDNADTTLLHQYLLKPAEGLTNPRNYSTQSTGATTYSPKIEYYRAFDFVVRYDKNALYGGAITNDGRLPLTVELHTPASSRSYDESGNNSYYSNHEFVSQSTASVAVPHQTLDLDTLVEQDDYNWQKNLSKSHYEKLTQWDDDGQGGLKTLIKLTPDNYWNSSAFNKAHNSHDGDQSYTVRVNIPHGFDGHMKAGLVSAENLAINNYSSLTDANIHHDSWGDYAEVKVPVTDAKAKYVVVQANPKTKHWKTYRQFNHTMQTTVDINQVKADGVSYGGHIATDGDYEDLNGQAVTVTGKALTEPTSGVNTTGHPRADYTDSLQSPVVIGASHGSWDAWQNSTLGKESHTETVKQANLPGDTSAKIQLPNIYQLQVLSATAAYRGENQWDQVPYLTTYSRMAALSVDDAHPTDFSRLGTNRIFGGAQRNSTEQAYAKTWGDLISIKDARSTHLTTNQTGQVMTMYSNNEQLAGTDHDDPTQRLHLATGNRYHRGDAVVLMGNPDSEAYSAPKTGRGDKWSMSSLDIKLPMNPISTKTLDHLGDNNQFNSVTTANLNAENQQYQTKQYYDHLVLSATDRGRLQAKAGYGMVDTTQLLVDRYDLHDPVTKQADLKTNATSDYYAPGQRRVAASVGDQIKPDRQATIFAKDGDSQRRAQDTATTQRLGLKTDSDKKSFFNLSLGDSLDGWRLGDHQRFDDAQNGSRVVMALRNVARDQGNGAKTAFTDTQNGNLNLSGYGSVRLSNALTISNVDKWAQRLFAKHDDNTYVNMDYTKRVVDADTSSSDQIDRQVQTAMDDQDHFKAPVTTKDKDLPATSVDGTLEGLDDTKTDQDHYQDHGASDQAATPHRSLTTLSYRYPSMQLPDQVLNHNTANEQPETFGFLLGFGSKLTDGDTTRVAKNMPADRYNDNGHYLYLRNDLSTGEYRLHYQSDHFGLAGATKIDLWRPVEIYGHRYLTKGDGQDDNDNDELNLQPVQSGKHKTDLKQSFDKHLSQKEWDELDHFLSNNTPSDN